MNDDDLIGELVDLVESLKVSGAPPRDAIVDFLTDYADRKGVCESHFAIEAARVAEVQRHLNLRVESLGDLAGGIAHDFNNILMGISGTAEVVMANRDNPELLSGSMMRILKSVDRAAETVRQMLVFAGRDHPEISEIDVSKLLESWLRFHAASLPENINVEMKLADHLPVICGDPVQIRRVFENVVTNAVRSVAESGGTVVVSTKLRRFSKEQPHVASEGVALPCGEYVLIEVKDDGCGMDPATKSRVFDPFFSSGFGGLGLGLSEAFGAVRNHGGVIEIESDQGRGTSVGVYLPVVAEEAPISARAEAQVGQSAGESAPEKQMTVLLVDDEDPIREAACEMLKLLGFEVIEAADGDDAVEIFRERAEAIDVVLLDMIMPRMSGEETLRLMRDFKSDVRVVIVSGYQKKDISEFSDGNGSLVYLQKPFRLVSLSEKIQEALAK